MVGKSGYGSGCFGTGVLCSGLRELVRWRSAMNCAWVCRAGMIGMGISGTVMETCRSGECIFGLKQNASGGAPHRVAGREGWPYLVARLSRSSNMSVS